MIPIAWALALGMLLQSRLAIPRPALLAGAALCLVAALILGVQGSRRRTGRVLLCCVFLLGACRWEDVSPTEPVAEDRVAWLQHAEGLVVSYPSLGQTRTSFDVVLEPLGARARLTVFHSEPQLGWVHLGDRISVQAQFEAPGRLDGFDYGAFLARRGIHMTAATSPADLTLLQRPIERPLLRMGDKLRQRLIRSLYDVLPPSRASLAAALLFGERGLLEEGVERAFERTGLMHLLATSGLHLAILLGGLWLLARRLGMRPAASYPAVGAAAATFLWIVGPRVSLLRAVTVLAFVGLGSVLADLGVLLRSWVSPLPCLGASACCLLLAAPWSLLDAGFQLSYAATGAILLGLRFLERGGRGGAPLRLRELRRWIAGRAKAALAVSLLAHAATAPLVGLHFGTYHPGVVLANLAAIPLVTSALWLDLATVALSGSALSRLVAAPLGGVLGVLEYVMECLARMPGMELPCGRPTAWWALGLGLWALGVCLMDPHRGRETVRR